MPDTDFQSQLDDVKADLQNLRTDVAELVRILKGLGEEKADDIKRSVEEELQTRREELRRRWRGVQDRGRQTVDDIEEGIGQHPLSSVLTAFIAGVVIAKLMDSGGRR